MKRKNLKVWRVQNDLTQKQLAESLGVTVGFINQVELGKTNPSYELILKMKEVYKIDDVLELLEKESE